MRYFIAFVFCLVFGVCSAQLSDISTCYKPVIAVSASGWNGSEVGYESGVGFVLSAQTFDGDTLRVLLGRTSEQAARTVADLSIFRLNGVEYDTYTASDTDGGDIPLRVVRRDGIGMLYTGGDGERSHSNALDLVAIRCNRIIGAIEKFGRSEQK